MRAELYPIADCPVGRLAIMPRPRAGDWLADEILSWRQQGMDTIVSLLEESEVTELGLEEEKQECDCAGLRFISVPIPDRDVPSSENEVSDLVRALVAEMRTGKGIGIHCRIGVGRSASLATCLLVALGLPVDLAWAAVQEARGVQVPDTPEQLGWVASWFARFQSTCELHREDR